jgi:NADH-quinone oxidoreductase subunit M
MGAVMVGFGFAKNYDRPVAIALSGLQMILLVYLVTIFQVDKGFQFQESAHWIDLSLGTLGHFSSRYAMGIDGLSLPLVLLTGLISFIALCNSK